MEINKLQQPYEQSHWRFSTAQYACSSWARSRHTRHVDTAPNGTCRIITGCLNTTPIPCLYALAGIASFPHRAYAERLPVTQIDASKKLIPDIHSMANALPSTGFHPETGFLTQHMHLTHQNKMLVPHCGSRSGTPLVNDQLSGVTEGLSQMNTYPAAQKSPGPFGGV